MAFSPDTVTVAWLVAPGKIEPVQPDQRWRCAGCNTHLRPEEAWLFKYRLDRQPDRARRDLICLDCATQLAGVASRTADRPPDVRSLHDPVPERQRDGVT